MQRFTKEEKLWAINQRLKKQRSLCLIASQLKTNEKVVAIWLDQYEMFGVGAFEYEHNTHYSEQLKYDAVQFYLNGKGSLQDTCVKYKIRSNRQLRDWISRYNSHGIKASPGMPGGVINMTKGRKTTFDERISIVEECIRNNSNYAETAKKYDLSYTQVYMWVRKYKQKGIVGLEDHRGRNKPESEMSDIEKLKAENRILKAELERKELENMFLKKVDEIERRRF